MDLKQLKNIMTMFEHSGAGKMEISESDGVKTFAVKLEKPSDAAAAAVKPAAAAAAVSAPSPEPTEKPAAPSADEGVLDYNLVGEIKSPMVGIFYAAPDPDSAPFVSKGDKVKKGDTLCLIEAMKLMNEVVAERDGEIVEVCVENGSLVEFGQVLFRIF
ncbi:MAG: acetyl-CoA carboxylase biotin carboxyl carrier protein [Clostridia bacterium]|nr:acetyl-CoA carboxylase biotin carboxyl carrier protein [Clostridia bacterium]